MHKTAFRERAPFGAEKVPRPKRNDADDDNLIVLTRAERRAFVVDALKIFPNVLVVHRHVGKRIGISYGTIWNIAKAERIKLIRFDRRWKLKSPSHKR